MVEYSSKAKSLRHRIKNEVSSELVCLCKSLGFGIYSDRMQTFSL